MGILTPHHSSSSQSNSPETDQKLRNYFTLEPAMDKSQYWWNHLTFPQRKFITDWYTSQGKELPEIRLIYNDQFIYDWHSMPGWPFENLGKF